MNRWHFGCPHTSRCVEGVTRFIFPCVGVVFVGFPFFAPACGDCFSSSARHSARYAAVARAGSARLARRAASPASSTSSIGGAGVVGDLSDHFVGVEVELDTFEVTDGGVEGAQDEFGALEFDGAVQHGVADSLRGARAFGGVEIFRLRAPLRMTNAQKKDGPKVPGRWTARGRLYRHILI